MGLSLPLQKFENCLSYGRVSLCEGNSCMICGDSGMIRAERAESCLIAPQKGDTVLLAMLNSQEVWVISVLARDTEAAEIVLPESTVVNGAKLQFKTDSFELKSNKAELLGKSLNIAGKNVNMNADILTFGGRILVSCFDVVRRFARTISEKAKRKDEQFGKLKQKVEGLLDRKAGRVREECRDTHRVRAGNLDVRAVTQIDMDAEHIKLG